MLTAEEFIRLFRVQQPNAPLDSVLVDHVIKQSLFVTARRNGELVGYVRILTDGYLFGAVADVRALPELFYDSEFLKRLLTEATLACPTRLVHAIHRADPKFMTSMGWQVGPQSYVHVDRPRVAM